MFFCFLFKLEKAGTVTAPALLELVVLLTVSCASDPPALPDSIHTARQSFLDPGCCVLPRGHWLL
jgi:hypothetical protein